MTTFNHYYSRKHWDIYFDTQERAVEAWVTVVMDRTVFDLTPYIDDMLYAERQGYDDIHHKLYEENHPINGGRLTCQWSGRLT